MGEDLHFAFLIRLRRMLERAFWKHAPVAFLELSGGLQSCPEGLTRNGTMEVFCLSTVVILHLSDLELEVERNIAIIFALSFRWLYFLGFVSYAEGLALNTKMSSFFPGYDELVISFIVGPLRLGWFALDPHLGWASSRPFNRPLLLKKSYFRITDGAPASRISNMTTDNVSITAH